MNERMKRNGRTADGCGNDDDDEMTNEGTNQRTCTWYSMLIQSRMNERTNGMGRGGRETKRLCFSMTDADADELADVLEFFAEEIPSVGEGGRGGGRCGAENSSDLTNGAWGGGYGKLISKIQQLW